MRRFVACALIAATLTALTAVLAPAGWFERLDGVVSDLAHPRGEADPSVAVVAIDQRALAEVDPEWPWSRDRYAELVQRLADAGAEVVVVDLVLAAARDGDDQLAASMSQVPTVLATTSASATSQSGAPLRVDEVVELSPTLEAAAASVAHAQIDGDGADGVVRAVPLVVERSDLTVVPSLSLAALALRDGAEPRPILRRGGDVQVGDRIVPTDDRYRLRVSWPPGLPPADDDPGPVLSAAEVMSAGFDPDDVRGRVVFVGVTEPTLGDQIPTPVDKRSPDPGVMAHAAAYHTMASSQYLLGPSTGATLAWVAVLSLAVALAVQFLPLPLAAASSVVAFAAALIVPVQSAAAGTLLYSVYPALAVLLAVPLSGAVRYWAETRLRRRVNHLFAQYVPPPVADELVRDGRLEAAVEGQRLEVSVFFCDLRGFTPLSASLEPVQVNAMLTHYYEYVSAKVLDAGGTIVQYVGDEVFAVFGAPLARDDHPSAAMRCALEVQAQRIELERMLTDAGLPMVDFGIGVNSGEVVAAHAGSSFRRQYSVVGDTVNVGSRLCSEALAGQVVAADATVKAASEVVDRWPGEPYEPVLKGVDRAFVAWRFAPRTRPPDTAPVERDGSRSTG